MPEKRKREVTWHHCDLCDYKTKIKSSLKKHKVSIHDIGVTWYHCDQCDHKCKHKPHLKNHKANKHNIGVTWHHCDLCDFKCKQKSDLNRHKGYKHDIGFTWHHCDLCDYKCKQKCNLKHHKADKHDIGVIWHHCDLCDFKCKKKGHLKRHKAGKHDIGVTWHQCDQCDSKFKEKCQLKQHKAGKHDIGVIWHHCDQPDCDFKAKHKGIVKQHKVNKHNIGVTWHHCDHCDYKSKQKSHLKQHKADKHDIDVTWHRCNLCPYKSKHSSHLNRHLKYVENIGNKTCQLCYKENLGVVKPYGMNEMYIDMCDDCAIDTKQKKRIEHRYTHYLKKHYDFPCRNDVIVRGDACTRYRPDIIYEGPKRILHVEIDEHEHQNKSGNYSCDEKRISDLYDEFQTPVPDHYIVIRLNPDSYQTEKKYYQVDRDKVFKKRAKILLKLMKKIQDNPPESKICIYYLYYSYDSNRIAKNIPCVMLNDENIRKYLK